MFTVKCNLLVYSFIKIWLYKCVTKWGSHKLFHASTKLTFPKILRLNVSTHTKTLFSISMHNTITYGKHSLLYLGPTLWSKLTTADRSVTLLASLKNRISKPDLGSLLDGGCRSCALCNS